MVVGCGQVINPKSSISSFPHQDGYRWEYKYTMTIGTSEVGSLKYIRYFNGTTTLSNGLTVQNFYITTEAMTQGINTLNLVKTLGLPLSSSKSYLDITETGVYDYTSAGKPTTEASLILPLPLEVGKVWHSGIEEFILTYEAIAEEEIAVPAGTFRTVKVNKKSILFGESDYSYLWYAEGVGMVKSYTRISDVYWEGSSEVVTMTEELVGKNF